MNNTKCILLSRVSTHSQDLKQQTDELITAAHKDGYTDDNIIIIEDKESAIKLSEEERNGLNEMKRHIETDCLINSVYVYEVSRIARKEKILFSIRDYLIERSVQLVMLNPYLKLLDENYEMTQSSQIMFAMFGAFSESEMQIKKQRLMRGKRSRAEMGYYIGGPVLFGYAVDKNKKLVIDDQKANIVRKMFNLYINGESISSIATELGSTGELDKPYWRLVYTNIYKILRRPEYYGGHGDTINTKYPAIISEELFNKVQLRLNDRSHPHSKLKYIYFAHKLLRCREDRHCFSPVVSIGCYKYGGKVYVKNENKELRVITWNININLIDSILWHYAKKYRKSHSVSDIKKMRKDLEEKILVLERKIAKGEKDIKDYEAKINKVNERIIMGKMKDKQGDKMIQDFEDGINNTEQNIAHWQTDLVNKSCEFHGLDMGIYQTSVDNVVSDKERHDIIHQCIKVVWVDKIGYARYKLEIVFVDDTSVCVQTIPNNNNRILLDDGTYECFEHLNRFSR